MTHGGGSSDIVKRLATAAVIVLLSLVAAGVPVQAAPADAPRLSLESAASKVRKEHGGRVVSATVDNRGSRPGYRIRLLQKDGRVETFWVDANTGAAGRAR